jgi:hypothetical protein
VLEIGPLQIAATLRQNNQEKNAESVDLMKKVP